nr:hypothetical protein [Tanacetum cinerariifolium]
MNNIFKLQSTCSRPDIDNVEVAYDGMSIDKADRKNECTYSQANTSTLDILIYSQANTSTLEILIKAFHYSNDHPKIDVLRDVNDVDRSVPNLNHYATAEPVHVYVLNNEEMVPNYALDDMKLQHEEDNLTVKERPVDYQPVDELIDVQKDETTLKNYVLRFVKERKKKLAMALDSPFGQQGTTTLALSKTRSMSSIGDTIMAPDFEEGGRMVECENFSPQQPPNYLFCEFVYWGKLLMVLQGGRMVECKNFSPQQPPRTIFFAMMRFVCLCCFGKRSVSKVVSWRGGHVVAAMAGFRYHFHTRRPEPHLVPQLAWHGHLFCVFRSVKLDWCGSSMPRAPGYRTMNLKEMTLQGQLGDQMMVHSVSKAVPWRGHHVVAAMAVFRYLFHTRRPEPPYKREIVFKTYVTQNMRSHKQLVSSRHYSSSSAAADTAVVETGTADNTDRTATEHNQLIKFVFHTQHLWVDLMSYFREPGADWDMVSPHFLPCILGGTMPDYHSNGVREDDEEQCLWGKIMMNNVMEEDDDDNGGPKAGWSGGGKPT